MFVFLRKTSIRLQLLSLGIAILIILIGAATWGYNRILHITYKQNSEYTSEMISAIKLSVVSGAVSINQILPNIAYNEMVQQFLQEEDRLKQFELNNKIEKLIVNLQAMKQGILSIVLLGQGKIAYNCVGCRDYIPFSDIPDRTSAYYSGVTYSPYYKDYVMYVGVPVYNSRKLISAESKIGYVILVLDMEAISPRIGDLSKTVGGNFYMLDRNGVVGSSNVSGIVGERLAPDLEKIVGRGERTADYSRDGAKFIVREEDIPEIGGKIVSVFPVSALFHGLEEVQRLMLGMFAVLIAVMYVLYIAISRNILHPIRSFITFIYDLRSKGLRKPSKRVSLEGYAEISIMARQFNTLLDEIDDLTAKLVDTKTAYIRASAS
ncbi:hypothetical protein ACFPYJ_05390 [Paenibacillus solisilvae]|uniref:HAMP domain-containing protein n=1 Tax=Paenibacillus solisilvae TaxID=2486751 RepID=A0ABW0VRP0_9BACL